MEDRLINVGRIESVGNTNDNRIAVMNFLRFPDWLAAIAMAIAEKAMDVVIEKYVGTDPVDVSHKTLNEIENLLKYFVEAVIRTEWEGIVNSSVEKFKIYNSTCNVGTCDDTLLDSILHRNIEGMYVLRDAGPSAVIAWMAAAQNVMAVLLIKYGENNEPLKEAAQRYIKEAVVFLDEAYAYNKSRVSDCNDGCEYSRGDGKWKCCYTFDGDKHCTKKQRKSDARDRCNQDADAERHRVIQEFELAVYNPAYVVLKEWEKIISF